MKVLNGIDIIEIHRVQDAIEKVGLPFKNRLFTKLEQEYCDNRGKQCYASYAVRFAAKEALSKALGKGFGADINPICVEVINDVYSKPILHLSGNAEQLYIRLGCYSMDLSLSHSKDYAIASVTILAE